MACTDFASRTFGHHGREREKEREAALVGNMSDGVIFCEENSDVWAYLGDTNEVRGALLLLLFYGGHWNALWVTSCAGHA